ncbi:MAG: hypothetical protein JWO31_1626, partial [Phycisphaerales bacterium]|nr:hypothetical protein [Phycisphaerales bacterium]
DPDPGVRSAVVRNGQAALADAPFAVAARALADPDVHVRVAAAGALATTKDKRAAAYLWPLLDDETVLHHDVRGEINTTRRACDEAVQALEMVVNGVYLLPGDKTQADYDALVRRWRDWRAASGPAFDAAQYDEPELRRAEM